MIIQLAYKIEDVPISIILALQHILAAFAGIIAVPLVVCTALGLSVEETTFMVSATIFASGITTIIQSKGVGPIGSRVSGMMGTDFTFVNPSISVGAKIGIAGIVAAQGIKSLSTIHLGDRELLIISVAFALGIGVTVKPEILNNLPEALRMILSSGISTGTLAALILNIVLKDRRKEI